MPSWLSRVLARTLRMLPDRLVQALIPARYGFEPAAVTPLEVPRAGTRLFIGPVNSAGQGWQWARAVERHLDDVAAASMSLRFAKDLGFPADNSVPVNVYAWSRAWGRKQERTVVQGFTHVIIEAEWTVFADGQSTTVDAEVGRMRAAGISVAMLCHGSDIRLPSRHAAMNPWSPFAPGIYQHTDQLERSATRNAELLRRLALPVFVSTPALLVDVPSAEWLPVVVDVDAWAAARPPLDSRELPVVAHAPSRGILKGSELVDPVLRQLEGEGLLRYRRIIGVPAREMPEIYTSSDIILDSFRTGNYGVAACEAMAAGRVVVAHVTEQVRAHVKQATGLELPIVQADANNLESVLRSILVRPRSYQAQAAAGIEFVRAVHDGRRSARVLASFLSGGERPADGAAPGPLDTGY